MIFAGEAYNVEQGVSNIWIEERSEGSFVPLGTLAQVRGDPATLADLAALAKLAAQV